MRTYICYIFVIVALFIASPVDCGKRKKNPKCDRLKLRDVDCYECYDKYGTPVPPAATYAKRTVCKCYCDFGCVKDTGAQSRECDVRPQRWKGGRGLTCNCRPCSRPPTPPLNYESSDCTGETDLLRGSICVFNCPEGYDAPPATDRRQYCENSNWRWSVTIPCTPSAGWGPWIDGPCSVACGGGTLTRTRNCDNPAPGNGGDECLKEDGVTRGLVETIDGVACNEEACPTGIPTVMPTGDTV